MILLFVALGAAVGAPLRYLIDRAVQARHTSVLPWGTVTVNVVGSLLLGFLVGLPAGDGWIALVGTGFSGALTTYSTFSYETLRLLQRGSHGYALLNVAVSVVAGLGSAYLGGVLATVVVG